MQYDYMYREGECHAVRDDSIAGKATENRKAGGRDKSNYFILMQREDHRSSKMYSYILRHYLKEKNALLYFETLFD